ncbi:hypothetical protein TNCV_991621 [Trichonephila clavipes]|nr:hypothetical protein TNCV_991621 [Trichonephila clavipes]
MKWGNERWSHGRFLSWSRADRAIEDREVSFQYIISPKREVELRWAKFCGPGKRKWVNWEVKGIKKEGPSAKGAEPSNLSKADVRS